MMWQIKILLVKFASWIFYFMGKSAENDFIFSLLHFLKNLDNLQDNSYLHLHNSASGRVNVSFKNPYSTSRPAVFLEVCLFLVSSRILFLLSI